MKIIQSRGAAILIGAASWTAAEYGLHRFLMHELRGRGLASVEHLKHHADVTYFSPTSKKLASAAATTAVAYPAAAALAGRRWATAFTAGLLSMYFGYEVAHRRTHTHPPRHRYGRWARRNHLHHHFGAPMRNFGVTSPVWRSSQTTTWPRAPGTPTHVRSSTTGSTPSPTLPLPSRAESPIDVT